MDDGHELRPPVMPARAAVSLDLLSSGRFELGIGGGRVWDRIEAMGGPPRAPVSWSRPSARRPSREAMS